MFYDNAAQRLLLALATDQANCEEVFVVALGLRCGVWQYTMYRAETFRFSISSQTSSSFIL